MAKIIAARLASSADAEAVLRALANQGFKRTEFQSFDVNHGGQVVAVRVDRAGTAPRAVETLARYGAYEFERTEGTWRGGDWKDFAPRTPPSP